MGFIVWRLLIIMHPRPPGRHIGIDRWQLTTNFEFWVEIFCVPTCFHMRIPKPSVCLYPRITLASWIHHGNPKIWIFFKKFRNSNFDLWQRAEITLASSISVLLTPKLVIDTSMERSWRVLHNGNPNIWIFFKKVQNLNFDLWRRAEITLALSISVLHG